MSLEPLINHNQYIKWRERSKLKLKEKVLSNIQDRIQVLKSAINNTIKSETTWKNIHSTIGSDDESYNKYNELVKPIEISASFIHTVTSNLYPIIEKWKGVNVEAMHKLPSTFEEYHKKAGNYWNTHTSKWLGDHLFYPLLSTELDAYIDEICRNLLKNQRTKTSDNVNISVSDDGQSGSNLTSTYRHQTHIEVHLAGELLKIHILKKILHTKIKFQKTRDQPVILDQSFNKSKLLKQLFIKMGDEYGVKWQITPNRNVEYLHSKTHCTSCQ